MIKRLLVAAVAGLAFVSPVWAGKSNQVPPGQAQAAKKPTAPSVQHLLKRATAARAAHETAEAAHRQVAQAERALVAKNVGLLSTFKKASADFKTRDADIAAKEKANDPGAAAQRAAFKRDFQEFERTVVVPMNRVLSDLLDTATKVTQAGDNVAKKKAELVTTTREAAQALTAEARQRRLIRQTQRAFPAEPAGEGPPPPRVGGAAPAVDPANVSTSANPVTPVGPASAGQSNVPLTRVARIRQLAPAPQLVPAPPAGQTGQVNMLSAPGYVGLQTPVSMPGPPILPASNYATLRPDTQPKPDF